MRPGNDEDHFWENVFQVERERYERKIRKWCNLKVRKFSRCQWFKLTSEAGSSYLYYFPNTTACDISVSTTRPCLDLTWFLLSELFKWASTSDLLPWQVAALESTSATCGKLFTCTTQNAFTSLLGFRCVQLYYEIIWAYWVESCSRYSLIMGTWSKFSDPMKLR